MTADLPPDVRDRAAEAARKAWVTALSAKRYVSGSGYLAVVDAVAGVLAEHESGDQEALKGAIKDRDLLNRKLTQDLSGLKAENERLRATMEAVAGGPDVGARRCDCVQLRARVTELEDGDWHVLNHTLGAALGYSKEQVKEMATVDIVSETVTAVSNRDQLRARAALGAGEEKPSE